MSETAHTPGPWECQVGHSDWGLPTAHIIVREGDTGNDMDTWIAEVPSVTPYCAGASHRDKTRASTQLANARLIASAPTLAAENASLKALVAEMVEELRRAVILTDGDYPTSAQRFSTLIARAKETLP